MKTVATGNALALMAQRVAVAPAKLEQTLMQTAFKGASPAEFIVLVAVANKYDLDPFMREIYAFPKKGGGIVPLVPIDGWLKIIKRHHDYAGMDVHWSDEMVKPAQDARECPKWVEVTIYHKSTPDHPTVHREWIDEMYRETGPWRTTTKRMLEWKGISQTGRAAFGLGGIYDEDEAERISEGEVIDSTVVEVERVGDDWPTLLKKAGQLGYSAADILANAGALGYEGPGPDMPRDIANEIYHAMQNSPAETADAPLSKQAIRDEGAERAAGKNMPAPATETALFDDAGANDGGEPSEPSGDVDDEPPGRGPRYASDDPKRPASNADKARLADVRAQLTDEQDRELMDGVDLTGATKGDVDAVIARAGEVAGP
jgi:phage recombination protein Bet